MARCEQGSLGCEAAVYMDAIVSPEFVIHSGKNFITDIT